MSPGSSTQSCCRLLREARVLCHPRNGRNPPGPTAPNGPGGGKRHHWGQKGGVGYRKAASANCSDSGAEDCAQLIASHSCAHRADPGAFEGGCRVLPTEKRQHRWERSFPTPGQNRSSAVPAGAASPSQQTAPDLRPAQGRLSLAPFLCPKEPRGGGAAAAVGHPCRARLLRAQGCSRPSPYSGNPRTTCPVLLVPGAPHSFRTPRSRCRLPNLHPTPGAARLPLPAPPLLSSPLRPVPSLLPRGSESSTGGSTAPRSAAPGPLHVGATMASSISSFFRRSLRRPRRRGERWEDPTGRDGAGTAGDGRSGDAHGQRSAVASAPAPVRSASAFPEPLPRGSPQIPRLIPNPRARLKRPKSSGFIRYPGAHPKPEALSQVPMFTTPSGGSARPLLLCPIPTNLNQNPS